MAPEEPGIFDQVKSTVKRRQGFLQELHDLYVSPMLAKACSRRLRFRRGREASPAALRAQFPVVEDVTDNEFIRLLREVLAANGKLPCTVIVLDEIQLYIGDDPSRSPTCRKSPRPSASNSTVACC